MKKFVVREIEALTRADHPDADKHLVQRLYDLGLHPGLEVEVIARISFNSVIIIQFGETRIALNSEEFACLHGH